MAVGSEWSQFTLTGVDINEDVVYRKTKDLHKGIVGDLRTINIIECEYDVIYSSFVLEHIDGAEHVLNNFLRWLKPGGILILKVPDRNSVHGFVTRVTPFWFHIFYKKYIEKNQMQANPDSVHSLHFMTKLSLVTGFTSSVKNTGSLSERNGGSGLYLNRSRAFFLQINLFLKIFHFISFGKLASDYSDLTYVIEK